MKNGPIITAVVTLLAMTGVVVAFMSNASPYVTVAEARQSAGDRLHLLGTLDKSSIRMDFAKHVLKFNLKDPKGEVATVRYMGEPQSLQTATEVVAIGKMQDGEFVSEQLLLKCPSKYEEDKKPKSVALR